ncbi:hypothetical protein FEM03_20050 [Phragmitibacter flavus]|uniref:DNA methylase adenine-specific domain-containing protein n=1 Tax=Phragmitibacter flavus TaxID=2576071 RepID=A0A5R8K9F9_9BACT|nr:N-6 DNA methylase [Phragmitibacter flavus]TLD68956.1 hypothetical protein FEM03_20050 [Phragmitibacter flavus]
MVSQAASLLIPSISLLSANEGEKSHRSIDLLGHVYDWSGAKKTAAGSPKGERGGTHQYLLTRFTSAEGQNGGHFYPSSRIVHYPVETLAPFEGRIYDPACVSRGMFGKSEKGIAPPGVNRSDSSQ